MNGGERNEKTLRPSSAPKFRLSAGWLAVAVFWPCLVVATLDRQIISITGRDIQLDLHLTDTQLGFIQGPAFAFCAALAGVPLGWLLDKFNRVTVSSICFALWSVATSLTGLAGGFIGLSLARGGGALGEAGLAPAALSIFADHFSADKVPRASATFLTAPFVGAGLGLVCGGLLLDVFAKVIPLAPFGLSHAKPWQLVFLTVGLPGLLLALVLPLLVKDPGRAERAPLELTGDDGQTHAKESPVAVLALFILGMTALVTLMYVQLAWLPIRFLRSFSITPAQAGLMIGPSYMAAGLLGAGLSAWLAGAVPPERTLQRVMNVILIATLLLVAPIATAALATDKWVAAAAFFVGTTLLCMALTLAAAPVQLLVPRRYRARTLGLSTVAFNCVGAGLGPFSVGFISDHLKGHANAIGLAIVIVSVLSASVSVLAIFRVRHWVYTKMASQAPLSVA